MNEAIRVHGLRKTYDGRNVVDGIDLSVTRGETFALLGPNGAGKTTTVEILEGYRRADGGTVQVLGADPQHAGAAWRARIGVVLQEVTDSAALSVDETVSHFALYYPDPRDPGELIEAVGLAEKAKSRVCTLSGGQRRRLDVALGLLGRPELLFLDEPTTGFDPQARHRFWDLLRAVKQMDDTTIVLTTHYLDEAAALADRIAVIADGRIIAEGTPEGLGGRRPGAQVSWLDEGGQRRTEHTDNPTARVLALADRFGGEVPGLQVMRPTLEDIYLEMISGLDRQEATR